jgi:HTH-like domain
VNIYPFIEAEKAGSRNVKRACELLKVSRAAFYHHLAGPSPREQADAVLTTRIKAVHAGSKGRYGAPRVQAQLARDGHRHGRRRVARSCARPGCAASREAVEADHDRRSRGCRAGRQDPP